MKKQIAKRLILHRETLAPLTADVLDAVAGGVVTTCTNTTQPTRSRLGQCESSPIHTCLPSIPLCAPK